MNSVGAGLPFVLQAVWVGLVGYAGLSFYRHVRRGELLVKDVDEPTLVLRRGERPAAFWSFVTLYYLVLAAMLGVVGFA